MFFILKKIPGNSRGQIIFKKSFSKDCKDLISKNFRKSVRFSCSHALAQLPMSMFIFKESLTLPKWKKAQVIEWKLSKMKWFLGAMQISMNNFRSIASYFSSAKLVRAYWHVFGKLYSKKLKQQLQVQQEKSFHLVLFEMVARRVSRGFCVTWTSKHCFRISARTHSKCKIEKPKSQLSKKKKKLMRGEKSHEALLQQNHQTVLLFLLCLEGIKGVRKREESLTHRRRRAEDYYQV